VKRLVVERLGITTGLLLALAVVGCAGLSRAYPTVAELDERGGLNPAADRVSLSRGRDLVLTRCGRCHRQYEPREYGPAKWGGILSLHGQRASLRREQVEDLTAYFRAAARWELAPSDRAAP
jgi:mono/diheme cytochrome c family protein